MNGLLERAQLYLRTARHLRWEQWVYRPIRSLQSKLPPPDLEFSARRAPNWEALAATVAGWGPSEDIQDCIQRADAVVRGEFEFLNHQTTLTEIDWAKRYASHLWTFNLHYFDYALDLARAWRETGDARYLNRFADLARSWIDGTAPGQGDGWDPYAISKRIVNWTYTLWLIGDALDDSVRSRIERSLLAQLGFLAQRLEIHLLGNHLQNNLKGLAVGGLYFAGPHSEKWVRKGAAGLWRELFEQVLDDGMHFERSPMYHAIFLGDYLEVLDLYRAMGVQLPERVSDRVRKMTDALQIISRPDGSLHLFNDSADGIAPDINRLMDLAERVVGAGPERREDLLALPDGGYWGWTDAESGERFLIDCGEVAAEYQPAHAHCDMLSFELDLAGRQVVVDSGTSGYGDDPRREYIRSTRAHNTVSIDGLEQSEVWGTFRVARRARPGRASHEIDNDRYLFRGSCTPFHDREIVHQRRVTRDTDGWLVEDVVQGGAGRRVRSFLHLHPDFVLEPADGCWIGRAEGMAIRVEPFGFDQVILVRGRDEPAQGWYSPEFGLSLEAPTLELEVRQNAGEPFGYRIQLLA